MDRRTIAPEFCSCGHASFDRKLSIPQRFAGGQDPFPCKINGIEFTSKGHQKDWMKENGFSLLNEWSDPTTVGDNFFDKKMKDDAPSKRAELMLKETKVLTGEEVKEQFDVQDSL
jgi:hypothetical protein